jgi:ribosomal protein S18 acetylase RimI-like enzyme
MKRADRDAVADVVSSAGNFSPAEIDCAMELVDIYLNNSNQADYHVIVAEDSSRVCAYACWGPVPLTQGTYDLYWIATHPDFRGKGFGRKLMSYMEDCLRSMKGRLLVIETSSKQSYKDTIAFYRSLGCEEASLIKDFYGVGDDRLIFVKRFSEQGD